MWQKFSTICSFFILSCAFLFTSCTKRSLTDINHQIFKEWVNHSNPSSLKIALLLPLEGQLTEQANAICNGFFAAYYQAKYTSKLMPTILVLNTDHKNINTVYQNALQKAANIIVGPLTKKNIAVLVNSHMLSVPTLALNTLAKARNPYLFQFGLSPLDEATQTALRICNDHHTHILMITPWGNWGNAIAQAFQKQLESLGDKITAQLTYKVNTNLNNEICQLLNIDQSELREQHLKHVLYEKIRFIPRRREDFDAIFLVANFSKARQIIPLLHFYYLGDIPIYATSAIYYPSSVIIDHDLDGVIFDDMPWVLAPKQLPLSIQQIQERIRTLWPNSYNQNSRLYALGVDAYQILPKLYKMSLISQYHTNSATGILYLLPNQQIYRQLLWAKIINGQPRLIK